MHNDEWYKERKAQFTCKHVILFLFNEKHLPTGMWKSYNKQSLNQRLAEPF